MFLYINILQISRLCKAEGRSIHPNADFCSPATCMVLSYSLEILAERRRYEDSYQIFSHMFSQSLQQPFEVGNSILSSYVIRKGSGKGLSQSTTTWYKSPTPALAGLRAPVSTPPPGARYSLPLSHGHFSLQKNLPQDEFIWKLARPPLVLMALCSESWLLL